MIRNLNFKTEVFETKNRTYSSQSLNCYRIEFETLHDIDLRLVDRHFGAAIPNNIHTFTTDQMFTSLNSQHIKSYIENLYIVYRSNI